MRVSSMAMGVIACIAVAACDKGKGGAPSSADEAGTGWYCTSYIGSCFRSAKDCEGPDCRHIEEAFCTTVNGKRWCTPSEAFCRDYILQAPQHGETAGPTCEAVK